MTPAPLRNVNAPGAPGDANAPTSVVTSNPPDPELLRPENEENNRGPANNIVPFRRPRVRLPAGRARRIFARELHPRPPDILPSESANAHTHGKSNYRDVPKQTEGRSGLGHSDPAIRQQKLQLLRDPYGQYQLTTCLGDNSPRLVMSQFGMLDLDCSEVWVSENGTIVGDGERQPMHYSRDTMAKLGVSPVRLSHGDGLLPQDLAPM